MSKKCGTKKRQENISVTNHQTPPIPNINFIFRKSDVSSTKEQKTLEIFNIPTKKNKDIRNLLNCN